jgi:hypothetical protein
MNKWYRIAVVAIGLMASVAQGGKPDDVRRSDDEDIFPISCYDFSGYWQADTGQTYTIEQRRCSWLRLSASLGSRGTTVTIVPDNRKRPFGGENFQGEVRYRWNAKKNARIVEAHRTMAYADRKVNELVMLEWVNENLILESTYRTIEAQGQNEPPRHEYNQQVYRRATKPEK